MIDKLQEMLDKANELQSQMELEHANATANINKLTDKKQQDFFLNSLSMAKKGELNINQFTEQLKSFTNAD